MNSDASQLEPSAKGDDSAPNSLASDQASCSASSLLRNAREAKNLTQENVAKQLFLTTAFIRYIDADQLDKILKPAFIRGYLRSYAKLVGIDGGLVVESYEASNNIASTQLSLKSIANASLGSINFTGPVFFTSLVGLVALALVIGIVWYLSSDAASTSKLANTTNLSHVKVDSVSDIPEVNKAISALEDMEDEPALEDMKDENGLADESTTQALEPSNGSYQAESTQSTLSNEALGVISRSEHESWMINIDAGGEDTLNFILTDDCWLEVRDAEERLIYEDLGTANQDITIRGIAPFKILVGKTPALTLRYKGEVVDLKPYTTSVQTATLVVGD